MEMKEEGRVDKICIPPWRQRMREGALIKICMPSWKQRMREGALTKICMPPWKQMHATMKTKDGGSVEIDLHPTMETRDEGGRVLTKGGREMWWR
jgi:hypothetical protein